MMEASPRRVLPARCVFGDQVDLLGAVLLAIAPAPTLRAATRSTWTAAVPLRKRNSPRG
jgi:hypothetical protein